MLGFGTATFGGVGETFKAWGRTEVDEAKRLVDICLEAGVTLFDTANAYSRGRARRGAGRRARRPARPGAHLHQGQFPDGRRPQRQGSSRYCAHARLRRQPAPPRHRTTSTSITIHGFDATTPVEETLSTLDNLIRSGKVRYIGCSNFSGWHLMKSLSVSERYGWARYVTQQVYYSLVARELEWELMPLALDQKVGTVVWSALAGGALSGKVRRGQALPGDSRLATSAFPPVRNEKLYDITDVLESAGRRRPARRWRRSRSTGCFSGRAIASVDHWCARREAAQAEPRRHRLER